MGFLYETYHNTPYNPDDVDRKVSELMANDAVTDKRGIFENVLGGCTTLKVTNHERQGNDKNKSAVMIQRMTFFLNFAIVARMADKKCPN